MNIDELIDELEYIKEKHGNLKVMSSDYELGLISLNGVSTGDFSPGITLTEDDYDVERGDTVAIL